MPPLPADTARSCCLECDVDGQIISVLKADALPVVNGQQPLQLQALVAPASQLKLSDFLNEVLEKGVCLDWEMRWQAPGEPVWMLVSGFKVYQSIIVVATSRTINADQHLLEEMMQINNEQVAQIRMLTLENLRLQHLLDRPQTG